MKHLLLLTFALFLFGIIQAQDVKLKKGKVLVDGVQCMKYDGDLNHVEFETMDGEHTILLKYIRTGVGQNDGLYNKVIFVGKDQSFTTRSYIFTRKNFVKKLISNGVITDCGMDAANIEKFCAKYEENIEESLIRY